MRRNLSHSRIADARAYMHFTEALLLIAEPCTCIHALHRSSAAGSRNRAHAYMHFTKALLLGAEPCRKLPVSLLI